MLSFIIIFMICAVYGAVHSLLAALPLKNRLQSWNAAAYHRWYRLWYNLFASITLLPVFATMYLLPDLPLYKIPWPWLVINTVIQLAGAAIVIISIRQTGMAPFLGLSQLFTTGKDVQTSRLTTAGLYRWVRHPIYSGGLLVLWFTPWMTVNYLAFALAMTIYIINGSYFEEKRLVAEYGDEYLLYRRKTPRLIPDIIKRTSRG